MDTSRTYQDKEGCRAAVPTRNAVHAVSIEVKNLARSSSLGWCPSSFRFFSTRFNFRLCLPQKPLASLAPIEVPAGVD